MKIELIITTFVMAANGAGDSATPNGPKLSEIFEDIWKTVEYVEKTNDATNSDKFQARVAEGSKSAKEAVSQVNELRLFSDNEDLEEVATNEMRYMLLSAMLGYFQLKLTSGDRLSIVRKAQLFFTDFLHLCKSYGVTDIEVPLLETQEDETESCARTLPQRQRQPDLVALNAKRQRKIDRFKQQKQLEQELLDLRPVVDREHVDDEVKREYYTKLLKKWINTSLEELESIQDELEILQHMAQMKSGDQCLAVPKSKPKQEFRPFILTKSSLQKRVYGAGYPSLPTYTVEEFFDQQMALGNVPQPGQMPPGGPGNGDESEARAIEREEIDKELAVENDDRDALEKARSWDDWKDDHRIGWGNTQNKG